MINDVTLQICSVRFAGMQNEEAGILDTTSCDSVHKKYSYAISTHKKFTEVSVTTHVDCNRREYDELRKKYRAQLLRSINITEGLLSNLAAIKALEIKVSNIRKVTDQEAKADMILSLPSDNNYEQNIGPFLNVLRENGHAHVANVFTTGSGEDLMTDDTYKLLNSKLDDLCNYLDPECGIVTSLISEGVFSLWDVEKISGQKTARGKVDEIVKLISRKSNSSYQHFIDILKQEDQEHIVYILTEGREGSPPISREDLKLIRIQRASVVENMESLNSALITMLMCLEVFTDNDKERVEKRGWQHNMRRNDQILNILARKSRRHFDNFIKALNVTAQEHVAELFEALTINATVNVNHGSSSAQSVEVEEKRKSALAKDLQNEESEISRNLDSIGIHAAVVSDG